ncbi:MAG: type II toxin-antitoxin system VapC family toxin [Candidatus Promineofilum sp.]|jgi:tRNA(fMet)-specific endonuclease VapC|nr:type II toxin-antitoxin system VapC family toxin [Promineifilum sp.]MCW5862460.1 type II toxin-antitoxin system VapC family toxin [Anaerolineae bacterium]
MSAHFLLDTNILSEPLRPRPNEAVLRMLRRHQAELATATLVWHELLFGCYRLSPSARRVAVEQYLFNVIHPSLLLLVYDEAAAQWHAAERARLSGLGRTPTFVDGQIAAIAATQQLTLVTHNSPDFQVFDGLALVDWFE